MYVRLAGHTSLAFIGPNVAQVLLLLVCFHITSAVKLDGTCTGDFLAFFFHFFDISSV